MLHHGTYLYSCPLIKTWSFPKCLLHRLGYLDAFTCLAVAPVRALAEQTVSYVSTDQARNEIRFL